MSEKKSKTGKDNSLSKTYVSKELYLDITKLENDFKRADIEIHNVDHSGLSYEGRVFLNNPKADQKTKLTLDKGYVGAYHIFGHGGCYGDLGHCDIPKEREKYDLRPSHHLKPQYKRVIITDALRKLGKNTDKFIISIVPFVPGKTSESSYSDSRDIIKFDKIGIVTYD
ncbi:MAG: hypothetical protein WBF33_25455 [Candidatus Nitrosopolaris sp.]|jgi:hypothetical protein